MLRTVWKWGHPFVQQCWVLLNVNTVCLLVGFLHHRTLPYRRFIFQFVKLQFPSLGLLALCLHYFSAFIFKSAYTAVTLVIFLSCWVTHLGSLMQRLHVLCQGAPFSCPIYTFFTSFGCCSLAVWTNSGFHLCEQELRFAGWEHRRLELPWQELRLFCFEFMLIRTSVVSDSHPSWGQPSNKHNCRILLPWGSDKCYFLSQELLLVTWLLLTNCFSCFFRRWNTWLFKK